MRVEYRAIQDRIGSGGFYGKGWLNGTQSQLDFLPESHTDFIIAVLVEEFGLLESLSLLLYGLFLGVFSCISAKSQFGRLFCGSFALMIFPYLC